MGLKDRHAIPTATLSRIAMALAVCIALILPLGYFTVVHRNLSIGLQGEAEILARVVGDAIEVYGANWKRVSSFDEVLARNSRQAGSVSSIVDAGGAVIASAKAAPGWPALRVQAKVYDAGVHVAQVVVEHGLRHLLAESGLAALLGLILGAAVFFVLRAPMLAGEAALRESEASLARAQRVARIGSWNLTLLDPENLERNPMRWSDQVYRILGYEPGGTEASHEGLFRAIHPEDRDRVREVLRGVAVSRASYDVEYRVLRADGGERIVHEIGEAVPGAASGAPTLIGTVQDITERKRSEDRIAYLARFDALTGLPNRHMLHERLAQALAESQRTGRCSACMFIDLDRFKHVNDTFGHSVGDKLLVQVAERLRQCVRTSDVVGRLGGDEFAVVLASMAKMEDATRVATKLIALLSAPYDLGGHQTYTTASVGIAMYPGDGADAGELLKNADTAMYHAKEQGRNNHQFYSVQMNERALRRLQLETRLRGALERGEFLLHYQPKAELGSGAICGAEALLRWNDPERGLVSPAEFIPILEETGLIVPVGDWVLETACRQIVAWQAQGIGNCPVAINVSARQIRDKSLDQFIARIRATGVDPGLIKLELTESMLMNDAEEAVRVLVDLKSAGVKLSVDDFGTGYSSLAYLKRFPLDEIKIDRAFIRDVATNPEDAEIVLAIIGLAHNLRLKVVAEGVESTAQMEFLRAHGCDELQGYLFSRPVPAGECTLALQEARRLQFAAPGGRAELPMILLVDDNPRDLELMRKALEPGGYEVVLADSARAAYHVLSTHNVAIIISDQAMPSMSGVEFLSSVRRLYPGSIRIVMSGSDDPAAITDAINEAGVHKFLAKGWDAGRLRAEVREALRRNGTAAAAKA